MKVSKPTNGDASNTDHSQFWVDLLYFQGNIFGFGEFLKSSIRVYGARSDPVRITRFNIQQTPTVYQVNVCFNGTFRWILLCEDTMIMWAFFTLSYSVPLETNVYQCWNQQQACTGTLEAPVRVFHPSLQPSRFGWVLDLVHVASRFSLIYQMGVYCRPVVWNMDVHRFFQP